MFASSLKDLQLNEVGKTSYTFKAVGAGFWALKQKDFRNALQDIVMEVCQEHMIHSWSKQANTVSHTRSFLQQNTSPIHGTI